MSKYTYIICGKLYNGIDAEFKEGYKILVKDNKIEAVGREIPQPETAEVVDLSDATVTPGMIDAHMHMDYIDWHTIREEVYTTQKKQKRSRSSELHRKHFPEDLQQSDIREELLRMVLEFWM